jgi:hypothetical protein
MDSSGSGFKPIRHVSTGQSAARIALVIALPVVVLGGLITIIVVGLSSVFTPGEREGFHVSDPTCTTDPGTNRVLLQIAVTATKGVDNFSVERLESNAATLTGVASLGKNSITSLDGPGLLRMNDQLADDDNWASLTTAPTHVVLELTRATAGDDVRLTELTLWWSTGEPAFLQHVPLNLEWSKDVCTATLG